MGTYRAAGQPKIPVSLMSQPAVVYVDVPVASIVVPIGHNQVGHLHEQLLAGTVERYILFPLFGLYY